MGIGIYSEASPGSVYSQGDFTNPVTFTADGRTGQVLEKKLYVHNDDSNRAFTNITIQPYDTQGDSHVDGTDGWVMKLALDSEQPTASGWAQHDPGVSEAFDTSIMLSGVAGLSAYLPFWVRLEVPREESIQSLTDIKLRLSFNEEIL